MRTADNLTTFMYRLSLNLGASASWNPQGLSRPVMGLLYLYLLTVCFVLTYPLADVYFIYYVCFVVYISVTFVLSFHYIQGVRKVAVLH